jgi:hypothetical protein
MTTLQLQSLPPFSHGLAQVLEAKREKHETRI